MKKELDKVVGIYKFLEMKYGEKNVEHKYTGVNKGSFIIFGRTVSFEDAEEIAEEIKNEWMQYQQKQSGGCGGNCGCDS